jgi:FtsP/CotA-like multicopper oxidase with cupredoxin domain
MQVLKALSFLMLLAANAQEPSIEPSNTSHRVLAPIRANDNRNPAGVVSYGTLHLQLRAAVGRWRPDGDDGPALDVEAFGEVGGALSAPSPLIRVTEGTQVAVSIVNELDATLRVNGLCDRAQQGCAAIEIPPAESREVRFTAGRAGTYYYWATTTGLPLAFRTVDAQLSGAFIVDPRGVPRVDDRIFVISEWTSITRAMLREAMAADDIGVWFRESTIRFTQTMNGLSWPATERLAYKLGETVHWRVINASTQLHPMHLHGFYFDVDSTGDGMNDKAFADGQKRRVVTELLSPGGTMTMTWTPERAGNWLFHCHRMEHVAPERRLSAPEGTAGAHAAHAAHDAGAGMAGMVIGVTVIDPGTAATASATVSSASAIPARKLTLSMQAEPKRYGDDPAYGFVLSETGAAANVDRVPVPGPTLVLRRGEPVEITLVNRLSVGTAIHWHGMELESYYDGVHGWSGSGPQMTPLIEPGATFVVRFTPPRTGTFMYHTHLHDYRQLTSGLYGAMLVVDPDAAFDESIDHVFVMGRGGPAQEAPAVLNGDRNPRFVLKAGTRHRVRLINITPDDVFVVSLQASDGPVKWRPLTKDGEPLPADQCEQRAAKQMIAVGETYDFEYEAPAGRKTLWLNVQGIGGSWQVQGQVIIK